VCYKSTSVITTLRENNKLAHGTLVEYVIILHDLQCSAINRVELVGRISCPTFIGRICMRVVPGKITTIDEERERERERERGSKKQR
jgi:hypothetical protein